MYPAGNLLIPVAHGQLEAILKEPRESPRKGVALVAHPHPLGGGTMHNKVVFRAAAALNEAGLTTLRFNFRGVGQSSGVHDNGVGEIDDVKDALDYLVQQYPGEDLTLCGFSFGALMGMTVGSTDDRVKRLISIGTPVNKYDFSFLEQGRKPLLLVHGERDEFGQVEELRTLADRLAQSFPVKLVVVPNTGHFFDDHLDELKAAIFDWVTDQLAA
ncbi:MAG TPA: alpha/beta fold hydrolase [Pyrinomonadaceae bacterium]